MDRLNYLYENAKEINIDNGSSIVFISDIHRGDGTYSDSLIANKNIYKTALSYYYRRGFTYVEVGDGDELWKNSNYSDIAYVYNDVFKILNKFKEENRLYLIYGNHDIIKSKESFYIDQLKTLKKIGVRYGNSFLKLIKDVEFYEGLNFRYIPLNEKFLVTHGHQADFINYKLWKESRFLVRYIWKFLNGIAGFKDPTSPAKNNKKGNTIDKKLEKWSKENSKMIICGHTHNSRMPEVKEGAYFNDGCCVLPFAMTTIEIEASNISLVKWNIDSEENGILRVKRKVISGPRKLEDYLLACKNDIMNKDKI